jgi:hypothetical protein
MIRLAIAALLISLAALPACGDNLVEFPLADGALADAGRSDASNDAAPDDAPDDAASSDASPVDASPADAASSDASPADARLVDASVDASVDGGGPPTVISTDPANDAINVAITKRITATFSRAMNPATIDDTTFLLRRGLTMIDGTVSYAMGVATFVPDVPLDLDVEYTASITTGAQDTMGTALAANHVWTFRTGACSQLPVDLLSAGAFAVLAGSTVTNTGPTVVTGDLGVSPGTSVTGFLPGILIGDMHAGDTTAAQAIFDLTAAYNNAAGRTLCPVSVAGNIGGRTLAPGLYKSTSGLAISSGDLTLDAQGDSDAVFIFQVASDLLVTSGRQVILTGGARASRVFWQVGSSAALGTGAVMVGTIMADQSITLATGATLLGRALARIALVSLDANSVTRPAP